MHIINFLSWKRYSFCMLCKRVGTSMKLWFLLCFPPGILRYIFGHWEALLTQQCPCPFPCSKTLITMAGISESQLLFTVWSESQAPNGGLSHWPNNQSSSALLLIYPYKLRSVFLSFIYSGFTTMSSVPFLLASDNCYIGIRLTLLWYRKRHSHTIDD